MPEHNFHPQYRPDIDGLRALAILPVVAYHAFPEYVPGGFIGVDIFFVISGYLISLIIFRSLNNNNFSFAEFYSHRIKRIFPALILITSTCYAVGWFVLLPDEFKQLGKHIAAGMGFVQNFILYKEAGYFDIASELKPLMHLWSLAVEEQFYLIYPLLVWAAWKARLNILTGLVVLFVISYLLNHKGIQQDAAKTFFAPQTRFWELMAGSILAYISGFRAWRPSFTHWIHTGLFNRVIFREVPEEKDRSALLASNLSFFGLALVVFSIAIYNHTIPYPGYRAIAPVLGSLLLILAGPQAWVNRHLLSRKMLVWVGLISYPLYLWHWPLLSFASIVESETPSRSIRAAAVATSFVLAAFTYYLIEKRIRYGRPTWKKATALCALTVIIGYIGYNAYLRDGLAFRIPESFRKAQLAVSPDIQNLNNMSFVHDYCKKRYPIDTPGYCRLSKDSAPNIIIIGDSHAASLFYGFSKQIQETSNIVLNVGNGGCIPFFDVDRYDYRIPAEFCLKSMNRWLEYAEKTNSIETVVLASMGSVYLSDIPYANQETERTKGQVFAYKGQAIKVNERGRVWRIAMRETINRLLKNGKQVVYYLDNPELDFHPKTCINLRPASLNSSNRIRHPCAISKEKYSFRSKNYRDLVISVLKDYPQVKLLDASEKLCDQQWCWAMKDKEVLYFDADHLSIHGSEFVANGLEKLILK